MKITKTVNHGNVRWRVSFRYGGKSHRRFFASEREAKQFGRQFQSARGLIAEVAALPQDDLADIFTAHQIAREAGFTLTNAATHYQQHRPPESLTVAGAAAVFLEEWKTAPVGNRQRRDVRRAVERFEEQMGTTPLAEVDARAVGQYLQAHAGAAATQQNHKTRLGRFFIWAVGKGWCRENPCKGAEIARQGPRDICWHTAAQAARLLAVAKDKHPAMVPLVALGYFCGLRVGEITGSEDSIGVGWDNVHLDRDTPEVEVPTGAGKTRQRRMVPIAPNAAKWLARGGTLYPFTNYRRHMEALREEADLGAHGPTEWDENIQRHTFASMHVAHHQRPEWTKYLMGHEENSSVFRRHYDGRVDGKEASRFWGIEP